MSTARWTTGDEHLSKLWFAADAERAGAEYALVHAIPCDPVAGVAMAAEYGVSASLIRAREDLRIIFLANELAGRFGRRAAFSLARRALRAAHCFNEDQHRNCRGPIWSTASLGAFWNEFADAPTPMQAMAIRDRAKVLLEINARQRDAEAHYRESLRILTPTLLPEHLQGSEVAA